MAKAHKCPKLSRRPPEAGDVYVLEIEPGRFGVCRVLQVRQQGRFVDYLLADSPWLGKKPPRLDEPQLRDILRLTHHDWKGEPEIRWVTGNPPEAFQLLGQLTPSNKEKKLLPRSYGAWESALTHIIRQWRWDHDRKRLLADDAREMKELQVRLEAERQAQLEALKQTSLPVLRKVKLFTNWKNFAKPVALRESRRIFRATIDALIPLAPPRNKKQVLEVLKGCVEQLNELERKHQCLATIECDDLVSELNNLFVVCGLGKESHRLEEWIDW